MLGQGSRCWNVKKGTEHMYLVQEKHSSSGDDRKAPGYDVEVANFPCEVINGASKGPKADVP